MSDDRHYLPPTAEHPIRWIPTATWHRVEVTTMHRRPEIPSDTFGRIINRRDYILFEDKRDATVFRLLLK